MSRTARGSLVRAASSASRGPVWRAARAACAPHTPGHEEAQSQLGQAAQTWRRRISGTVWELKAKTSQAEIAGASASQQCVSDTVPLRDTRCVV